MEGTRILSLTTQSEGVAETAAFPSPVLDLLYACYYLGSKEKGGRDPLDWVVALREDDPQLFEASGMLMGEAGMAQRLFGLALDLGYYEDEDVSRFLADLPPLLIRGEGGKPADAPDSAETQFSEESAAVAQDVLRSLWLAIEPVWKGGGQEMVIQAAQKSLRKLAGGGDVIEALPERHFLQFEGHVSQLREEYARGRLRIVPLAFAAAGGFFLNGERVTVVGFGMYGERVHSELEDKVRRAADKAKVLGDPTRLMLLSFLVRFESMPMTVGDLARHVGVSQPTVSGHLKLLKAAGLIRTERKGNKTYPKVEKDAVEQALQAVRAVLAPAS